MKKIAVLISGSGSNLQALIDACKNHTIQGEIKVVISNRKLAFGLERAKKHNIDHYYVPKKDSTLEHHNSQILDILKKYEVDLVVLAGYLSIISKKITSTFPVINIHPSLIPAFCGMGYHGLHVHEAAIQKGVKFSGATTHFVDEGVDTGSIIDQSVVSVDVYDTAESLQQKVLEIEHPLLVKTIKAFCEDRIVVRENRVVILEESQ